MIFTEAALPGAYLIEMTRTCDTRGFFARSFSAREFAARGLPAEMPECSVSFNSRKGTLRGLHFQAEPYGEDKLVRCTAGAIFDVIVDLRPASLTYRRWFGAELTAHNHRALFVPKGFAHGFITLADATEVLYMISVPYAPGLERGVRWNDPALGIEWPLEPAVLSARDAALPLLDGSTGRLKPNKRVLVTGASGFLGRSSVAPLAGMGYEVHGAVSGRRADAVRTLALAFPGAKFHRADLLDPAAIDALIEEVRPSHLLHFAWIATPGIYPESAENAAWLAASEHLMHRFRERGGVRAVMAGSCAEYDWSRVTVCHERLSPLARESSAQETAYAECKIALQRSLDSFAAAHGLSAAWGRIFFQFGPHEHPQRLVASVIIDLLQGREARCTHGAQVRSFLHVADVGGAFAALLNSEVQGPVNIGSGESMEIRELLVRLSRRLGRPELLNLGARAAPANEPATLLPDIGRLRDEVGFRPQFTLDEGLADTIEWWRTELSLKARGRDQ